MGRIRSVPVFNKTIIARLVGRLGSEPRLVGRIRSVPVFNKTIIARLVSRIGSSGVRVSVNFQKNCPPRG